MSEAHVRESNEMTESEASAYRKQLIDEEWGDGAPEKAAEPDAWESRESMSDGSDEAHQEDELRGDDGAGNGGDDGEVDIVAQLAAMNDRLSNLDNLAYRLKQAESRLGSVQNAVQNGFSAAKKAASNVANAPDESKMADAAKSNEEWQALKADYPEWAEVMNGIEKRMAANTQPKVNIPDVDAIRSELKTDFDSRLTNAQSQFEIRLVDVTRPGWRQTVKKPEYVAWLAAQPEHVKNKSLSDRAEDAIEVLDLFSEAIGTAGGKAVSQKKTASPQQIKQQRAERLKRAQTTPNTGAASRAKSIDDMTDLEYREYLARNPEKL